MILSRAARSLLSTRLATSRASLATRATAGYGTSDDAPRPGAGAGGGGAHPAPPLPHRDAGTLDKERDREEHRRRERGSAPDLDAAKVAHDPGAEHGPVERSLHSVKGKMKEAVGSVAERASKAFTSEGAIGREFERTGGVGSTVQEAVGGPFKADKEGQIGHAFTSEGVVGGTIEAAAEVGEEAGKKVEHEGKQEKEEAKK